MDSTIFEERRHLFTLQRCTHPVSKVIRAFNSTKHRYHDIFNVYIDVFNLNDTRLLKYMSSLKMHGAHKDMKFIINKCMAMLHPELILDHEY